MQTTGTTESGSEYLPPTPHPLLANPLLANLSPHPKSGGSTLFFRRRVGVLGWCFAVSATRSRAPRKHQVAAGMMADGEVVGGACGYGCKDAKYGFALMPYFESIDLSPTISQTGVFR